MKFKQTIDETLEYRAINGVITKYRNDYDVNENKRIIKKKNLYRNGDIQFARVINSIIPDYSLICRQLDAGLLYERKYPQKMIDEIVIEVLVIKKLMDSYLSYFELRNKFIEGKPQYMAYNKLFCIQAKLLQNYQKFPEKK